MLLVGAVIHGALDQLALAGAADAVAAAVGDDDAFAQRGREDGFTVVDGERVSACLDRDLVRHGPFNMRGYSPHAPLH
ncbi:hypothetical protein D3C83_208120 [compost metagenome]